MLNCTAWKRHTAWNYAAVYLGIASMFKMYHVFQNFSNGHFTRLRGAWLSLVTAFTL